MPEPDSERFEIFGTDYIWDSPEMIKAIEGYYGKDFMTEYGDWKTGKAELSPRSSWDYLLKKEARPEDQKVTQRLLDKTKLYIDAGKYATPIPTPSPTPKPEAPGTWGGAKDWLSSLLGG